MWNDKESLTPELFCKEIERIYRDLREPIKRTGIELPENVRITRSRSHTASSQCEDLLAVFIAQRVEAGSCVHIDQGLSATLGGEENKKVFYPDVAVVKQRQNKATVTDLFDLKTDIGFNRPGFDGFVKEKSDFLSDLRVAKKINIRDHTKKYKDQKAKCKCISGRSLEVSNECAYHIIVISQENAGITSTWCERKAKAKKHEKHGVYLYTLSRGMHPNGYIGQGCLKVIDKEFKRLKDQLSRSDT